MLHSTPLDGRRALGEMLFTLRPVAYVAMIVRFGRKSWTPWLLSLAIDLLSRSFSRRNMASVNRHERAELMARQLNLLYYFLRSPFFDKFLASFARSSVALVNRIPVVNWFTGDLGDYLLDLQRVYFYTAAS